MLSVCYYRCHAFGSKGLAAETEVMEPRLSAVLMNFESQSRHCTHDEATLVTIRERDIAQEVHVAVRGWLAKLAQIVSKTRILYGGSESKDNGGGHWKSRSKKKKSSGGEDDLSQSWVCEEIDPFTPRIRYFDFLKTRMPSQIKTYDGKRRNVKGAPKCMRISGLVRGITNPELIKRLHDKILKTVDEMMRVTTSFLRGEVEASDHDRKKSFPPWKQQEAHGKLKLSVKGGVIAIKSSKMVPLECAMVFRPEGNLPVTKQT
nr:reverse transcriptase domain-containing protein [Tanacetum cinerariifolium]